MEENGSLVKIVAKKTFEKETAREIGVGGNLIINFNLQKYDTFDMLAIEKFKQYIPVN